MKLFRREEGFTLVELMVVVLIIGILVAIAIPVFSAAQANARNRSCQGNQRILAGAVQTYLAETTTATAADVDAVATIAAFVQTVPTDPGTGAAYTITDGVVQGCPSNTHTDL